MCLRVFVCLPVASSFIVLCFLFILCLFLCFMFTVYCLMDPCGLISNKDDDNGVTTLTFCGYVTSSIT